MAINGNPTWVTDARAIMDNNAQYIKLGNSTSANNDKGMDIYIDSTTTFKYRWTGDQTWTTPSPATLSSYPSTAPAQLGTTGVYLGFDTTNGTFGDESYFLIPSWAIEQFSNSDWQNAMRGTRRSFPERSYLVATDKGVDIIDADDNTLWMRIENGAGRSLATFTNNTPSSVFMTQGQLFIGTNGSAATGLYRFDFNRDKIYRYDGTNRTTNTVNIAKRNTTDSSYGSADTAQSLQDSIVNDVHLLVSQGQLLMATANNAGLTKSSNIQTSATTYRYSDVSGNAYKRARLTENFSSGSMPDMYGLNTTNNALERWNNVIDDAASEQNGTPDATYNATSTPALFATAQAVYDLAVTPATSTVVAADATVYVAHAGGTTVVNENRTTLASGSVKYYTKDYISEEMIGDIRGMWPLDSDYGSGLSDVSLKALSLTNNGTTTFTTSGVRESAASFNGTTQYLNCTNAGCGATTQLKYPGSGSWAIGAWYKPADTSGQKAFVWRGNSYGIGYGVTDVGGSSTKFNFWARDSTNTAFTAVDSTSSMVANNWYFVVGVYDASTLKIYINGTYENQVSYSSGIFAATTSFFVNGNGTSYMNNSVIDEPFVTATNLSATQIQQMYVAGKEALTNKRRTTTARDTPNQLAGTISVTTAIAAATRMAPMRTGPTRRFAL